MQATNREERRRDDCETLNLLHIAGNLIQRFANLCGQACNERANNRQARVEGDRVSRKEMYSGLRKMYQFYPFGTRLFLL